MNTLNNDEIEKVQKLINLMPHGVYELSKIFGNKWISVTNPNEYGVLFKETVERKLLANISLDKKKSNNHQTYRIE